MIQKLVLDLEFLLEIKELKKLGLTDEEINGYFELYAENWVIADKDKNTYAN